MNATTVTESNPKTVRDFYPMSSKLFTEEQLLQHMRIPGSLFTGRCNKHLGVFAKGPAYSCVSFGADEEEWTPVVRRRRGHNSKWMGNKEVAMGH